jgi:hypothetical protein
MMVYEIPPQFLLPLGEKVRMRGRSNIYMEAELFK